MARYTPVNAADIADDDSLAEALVTTAVDDADVTAAVARDAEAAGIFCNAADRPEHCTATLPAVLRDGDLTVAVSTAGRSPAAASWVRDRIGRLLGPRPGRLVERAAAVRDRVRRSSTSEGLDWAALLDLLAIDDGPGAERAVDAFVAGATGGSTGTAGRGDGGAAVGHVRLVGAGRPQIWMTPFFPDRAATGADPTAPAFRLPFQDLNSSNHIAQWTERVVPVN